MDKKELSEALLEFYGILDRRMSAIKKKRTKKFLSPECYVLIGGGSLVLQGILPGTPDIDLVASSYMPFNLCVDALEKENIRPEYGPTNGSCEYVAGFDLAGEHFEIHDKATAKNRLAGSLGRAESVALGHLIIRVRPAVLIEKDYQKVLHEMVSLKLDTEDGIGKYMKKLAKYTERLEHMRRHLTVTSL